MRKRDNNTIAISTAFNIRYHCELSVQSPEAGIFSGKYTKG